jgi:two-component system NtrC family response regulator
MKGASILIVDDEEGIRHGLETLFSREGFTVHTAAEFDAAVSTAEKYPIDAAVVDVRLRRGRTGIDLLVELKRHEPDIVVIIITGYGSIDSAVTSLKSGAADYFLKPIDNERLLEAVRRNLRLRALAAENRFLRDELARRCLPSELITTDPAMRGLIATADKVKDAPVTVLLTGESGTGKEVLARHIHFTGSRRDREFVSINCAALSESLLLSELFGHERGAFTGAVERRRGKFELADGGTLFLDEIGDMSLEIQGKFLRVLEEASFERLGGVKRISVDVRIIAATNQDLSARIAEGKFREDLFYRINVVSLRLPPLRERRGDIPLLVDHFAAKYAARYGREPPALGREIRSALEQWHWPGNVRELENTVNQIVLLGEASFPSLPAQAPEKASAQRSPSLSLKAGLRAVTEDYERRVIQECLARNSGNKSKSARELGVTRKTLAEKMGRYGLG